MSQNLEEYKEGQLLRMTIQIDDKRIETIDILDGDEPEQLATEFCKLHSLNQRLIPILTDNINKNMQTAIKEKQNMSQYLIKKQEAQQIKQLNTNQVESPGLLNDCQTPKSPNLKKGLNVFDRLYQVAQDKKIRQQLLNSDRKPSINLQNNQSDINYGQQLYQRGMSQKEILLQKVEHNLLEKQQSVMLECTYKPQINQHSCKIIQRSPEPIGSHLNKLAKQISEKKEQALINQIETEQNQCTFHPKIDKQSEAIIEEKRNQTQTNLPHYEQLYREKEILQKKKLDQEEKFFQEKHTFHPKIDAQSEQLVQGGNFEERQLKFQESLKNKKPNNDDYFRPKTGRPPEQQRPQNLFESLYNQAQQQAEKKAFQLSVSMDIVQNQSQVKASQRSEEITQQSIYNKISQIFDILDSDQDGEIDSLRIDKQSLDPEVLKVLTPLFLQMEEGKHCLQKEQFIQIIFKSMSMMSNKEKHDLLKKPKKNSIQKESYSAGKNASSPKQFFK